MGEKKRETLGSRLGFLLLSAGCAIGLGNVWRFPYITGKYGGAAFVLIYLVFLVILGLPVMVCEFAVGRASRKSMAGALKELEPAGTKWHWYSGFAIAGNYLLMMFYTVVSGWFLKYFFEMIGGKFTNMSPDQVGAAFGGTVGNPVSLVIWMVVVIVIGFATCFLGLQQGVERITKFMMSALFIIMVGLAIYVATIPGAGEGYKFYLKPDFKALVNGNGAGGHGLWDTIYAAMGQAFFTLSLGIGSMEIFGSYIGKENSLTGESIRVIGLDTFVAICAGLIIFPACAAFGVQPGAGAGLAFVSLPNVFNAMGPVAGRVVGGFFFLFMAFAALSTVIAVFENIVAFPMDKFGWSRTKSVLINFVAMLILATPAALGMNIWSGVHFGAHIGSIDALEDFIVSQNLLPLGSLIFLCFCMHKKGWGWDKFIAETDAGNGIKFPKAKAIQFYLKWIAPIIILVVFIAGYFDIFGAK
ncbi:MAG: sodium-dependent transporter [Spirochaetaceae bacterium]|nr:sodium-dependent transporter [Spirochaetaceae bacterium]